MSLEVGMDLVDVSSVRDSVEKHADRYLERVYTARELRDCGSDPRRLAARFAAKEATIKALRPERGQAVAWRDVGVRRQGDGSVELELTGTAAGLAAERGIEELSVSLSHEGEMAGAVVVAR
jgi:holo-[acyl-carrier protein] synthase